MKKITLLLMLLASFSGFAQFPLPYCGPMTYTSNVEPITLVNFAGINNTSSPTVGTNNGTTIIAHEDYTAITGNVVAGSSYPITLQGNTDGNYTTYLRVYVDWNQNNVFTDAGESYDIGTIVNSTGVDAVLLNGNITVPPNALAGNTRMRVIKRFNVYGTSCQTGAGYGQAEDYTLAVTIPTCPAPFAGLATVTSSTTAGLTWTSGGAANAEVVVQLAGLGLPALPDNTGVNVGGNTYTASTLLPQTAYEFYVRDECVIGSSFSTWSGPFAFNTTLIPGCATNLAPVDGATGIVPGTVTFSWNAPTTGDPATSYDLYYGLTPGNATILVGNYLTTTTTITITGFSTTFYWKIVPKNIGGSATGCAEWSFTTIPAPGYCLSSPNGQWPTTTYTPTTCDGLTSNTITTVGYAGEYSVVNVTLGQTYVFASSIATDLVTISADNGATAAAYGTTPVTWVSTLTGTVNFYTHVDNQCGAASVSRTRSIICGVVSTDLPDYVNLQYPPTATITQGGTVDVYGQIYKAGLTDVEPGYTGQAAGINAWVGYSATNTNPNTWTNWVAATWNAAAQVSNNDEYMATIGATLVPGTYYYATRFNLNGGAYVYGGINASLPNNGNFWDGATFGSGVLTVNAPPAPANDVCSNPTPLTPGGVFADYAINTTNFGATLSSETPIPTCGNFNFATVGKDVWYSVIVPASGSITIETATSGTTIDTALAAYTGDCTSLVQVGCNDDINGGTNNYSSVTLTGQTAGAVILARVYGYNGASGTFQISAFDGSLATANFDSANFSYYPNPVKNSLNLSYSQNISSVSVFNLLGQEVVSKIINANQSQIDMSNLSSGAYLVKVTSENQVKTIKVFKE